MSDGQIDDLVDEFTRSVTFPADIPKQEGVVTATVYTLYGAIHTTGKEARTEQFDVAVTFGDSTSSSYKEGKHR